MDSSITLDKGEQMYFDSLEHKWFLEEDFKQLLSFFECLL